MRRIIGTAAPLGALWSQKPELAAESGTTAVGRAFLQWLKKTGQSAWQLLPLSETHLQRGSRRLHVPSPYKGYGIGFNPAFLPQSYLVERPSAGEMGRFLKANREWIDDYALFAALRDRFGTDDWTRWPAALRDRRPAAVKEWRDRMRRPCADKILEQWRLDRAFGDLRRQAREDGIALIGDLSFYIPLSSPLVWAHRECFDLGWSGRPRRVSGVPEGPMSFYRRQVWGHPLYRWRRRAAVLKLWRMRIDFCARFYDLLRLDHAKGFFSFGAMHPTTPLLDRIRQGPGPSALKQVIGLGRRAGLEFVAEDAGDRLEELRQTLRRLKVAGIRTLRFAYNDRRREVEWYHASARHFPVKTVAYTSIHDTEPLMGYLAKLTIEEKRLLAEVIGVRFAQADRLLAGRLIRVLVASQARWVILPIQDWLFSKKRINVPGTEKAVGDRNWRYRVELPVEKLPDTRQIVRRR